VIIGLVGGIACGKSTVGKILGGLGAAVINADELTHRELDKPETVKKVKAAFGPDVVEDGVVSRNILADLAFADAKSIKKLTDIVHPPVIKAVNERLRELDLKPPKKAVVIEAALLIESGLDKICDNVVYIYAGLNQRLWRAKKNRLWGTSELKRREKFQILLYDKREASNYEINNNLSFEYTRRAVEKFWNEKIAPSLGKKKKIVKVT
jgi:dephospho-CoA kinase